MVMELTRWDEDYVDELCDIVFEQFLLGNIWCPVPHDLVWDVITHTLNAWIGKAFQKS